MFETITAGFRAARERLQGETTLTEGVVDEVLSQVRRSLLEADVALGVVKSLMAGIREEALGTVVKTRVTRGGTTRHASASEQFLAICQAHLEAVMAPEGEPVKYRPAPQLTSIMMVGLQGVGKTTSAAKLARHLEAEAGRRVLLVAADVQRPGAVEQLHTLGEQVNVPVFGIPGGIPQRICEQGLARAKTLKRDLVIFDTAGRLAIDEALMAELEGIREGVRPDNTFLVVDAMMGQDAVNTAARFHERLTVDGVIMTKMDGDARGGAAISVREVTGAPVRFVGMGEGMDQLEPFRADGMASRILGHGDMVGLMRDFEGVVDAQRAEQDAQKMLQGQFTFDDFLEQIAMVQRMGNLQDTLEKIPFFQDSVAQGFQFSEKELGRTKAMVHSMTREERRDAELFVKQPSRVRRVARGSGNPDSAVANLIQRFSMMKQMMGQLGDQASMLSKVPGLKQLAKANRLREAVKVGGLKGNPMMSHMAEDLLASLVGESQSSAGDSVAQARSKLMKNKQQKKSQRKQQRKARRKSRK